MATVSWRRDLGTLWHGIQVCHPFQCGSAPNLLLRPQFSPLTCGPDADAVHLRIADRCCIDGRAALGTKPLRPFISVFSSLHVNLGLPAEQLECFLAGRDGGAKCRTGKCLAIGAMAYSYRFGVHFGLVSDVTAMTSAFYVHGNLPGNYRWEQHTIWQGNTPRSELIGLRVVV